MNPKGRISLSIGIVVLTISSVTLLDYLYHRQAPTPKPITTVEKIRHYQGITEYRLPSNDLTVLLLPDPTATSTTVNMIYRVGSGQEEHGQTGAAHLLEHMIFRGHANHKNSLAEFSKRGLSANGSTDEDRTNYFATFPSSPETLEWYLRWQADAMTHSDLLPEALETEKTVVRNELEQEESNNASVLLNQTRQTAYQAHGYGHTVLGHSSDLEHIDATALRHFYSTYYQPDNAVLVLAGSFDPEHALKIIADIFGNIPRPNRSLPVKTTTVEPIQAGERRITVRRPASTPLVMTLYHGPHGASQESAALQLATQMLGDRSSGRLNWGLVDQGLATQVYGDSYVLKDPGLVIFMAEAADEKSPYDVLTYLNNTVESIADSPFTVLELAHAKRVLQTRWDQLRHDPHQVAIALSSAIGLGDWRLLFQRPDLLSDLPLEVVQQTAERYLIASNRTEGLLLPADNQLLAPSASAPDLSRILSSYVGDGRSSTAKMSATAQAFEPFEPTFEYIQSHTVIKQYTHKNGSLRIALLPKPSSGQRVQAFIRLQFGDLQSLRGKREIAAAAVELLSAGNEATPYQALEDQFANLKSDYLVGGSPSSASLLLRSQHNTLVPALHLAFHILKTPSYPQDQLDEWINAYTSNVSNAMHDPDAVAQLAWNLHHNYTEKSDIRHVPSFQEKLQQIKTVSRDSVQKFHDEFYGANDVVVVLVGDFETEPAVTAILQELEDWQPGKTYVRIPQEYHPSTPSEIQHRTPEKPNAVMIAALTLPLQATNPDYPALLLANNILGEAHHSRLWKRIRDTEGLSYGIQSTLDVSLTHSDAAWGIRADFAPQNKARLQQLVFDELQRALDEGFTQEELDAAKASISNFRQLALTRDDQLVPLWMNTLADGLDDLSFETTLLNRIESLTLSDVNNAFKKYIQPQQLVKIYAGDFAPQKLNKPVKEPAKAS